jgi:hypothetical protein
LDRLLENEPELVVGLFCPLELADGDLVSPTLRRAAQNQRLRVLFGSGTCWGAYFETHRPNLSQVSKWTAEAKTDSRDLLKNKVIRRVGRYKLRGQDEILVHYLDGRRAFSEIYDIVFDLLSRCDDRGWKRILFDSRLSAWFEGPVEAALQARGLTTISASVTNKTRRQDICSAETLLMLPIVRSGRTVRKLLGKPTSQSLPEIWSLLSTAGGTERDGRRSIAKTKDGVPIWVNYALRVSSPNERILRAWTDTQTKPADPLTEDLAKPFSAMAMWGMTLEAGIAPEKPVPKHREPLGYVPDFGRIAVLNGPFIAEKVQASLSRQFGGVLSNQLVFLCPAEPNARDLATCLRDLAGHDTIHVSRELIDPLTSIDGEAAVSHVLQSQQSHPAYRETFAQLKALAELCRELDQNERPQIVLIDEFSYSNSTIRGLYNLATAYGLRVLCSVCLGHFGDNKPDTSPVAHLALYHLNYNVLQRE